MVSSVKSSQVRTAAAQQKTPSKPAKDTAASSQTAAAGWGAGAKAASLKITSAQIGDGPAVTEKLQLPKGYAAEVKELKEKLTDKVNGKACAIEQTDVRVTLTGPGGKKLTLSDGAESIKQTASDWKSEIEAQKKEPSEWAQLDWDASHTMSGVGTAGKLFSVSDAYSSYTGGAHPNHGTALSTWDASTGKQVKLDQLLTQQQMTNLVKDISARLPKLNNGDGIDGSSFGMGDLRDTINSNFALTSDKNGKVQIQIAWESGIHALGGQMAHFTVDAPTDATFRKAIGLE
ncbi:MAG: hypothetical protein ACOZQL_36135 [Myxococcota bacterium]